uniref:Putative serine carboxypeptidase lysosomal cathepsin a n=1 Tax=Amblyomma triste TaxID=251400 RepID=A0A023GPA2_AMBTT
MEIPSLCWCLLLAGCLQLDAGYTQQPSAESSADDGADPLFLSPLIKDCNISEARAKSNVTFFKQFGIQANAHSGYITVNEETGSNLFFLFIEAEQNCSAAPLMLWTQGGPGLSSLFGLLLQNGPVAFEYGKNISKRDLTIQQHVNIIYLDAPVGAGFSFTNNQSGYPRLLPNVTKDIKEFLNQFLVLFPEFMDRDFYTAGDSYGARYSVALAQDMLSRPSDLRLYFQGVIGGVGFLGPIFEIADSSEFLLQTSMLNQEGYKTFKEQFEKMRQLASTGNMTLVGLALKMLFDTIFTSTSKTHFQNLTLYNDQASPLYTERPLDMISCVLYANSSLFKTAIHAGVNSSIQYANPELLQAFVFDWALDITQIVEYVLNKTRVLFYTGQIDALFPSTNLQGYFEKLNWTYKEEYVNADRHLWRPYAQSYNGAGYLKSMHNFTSMVMLGMSHFAGYDKPVETYYLMREFIERNISFSLQTE